MNNPEIPITWAEWNHFGYLYMILKDRIIIIENYLRKQAQEGRHQLRDQSEYYRQPKYFYLQTLRSKRRQLGCILSLVQQCHRPFPYNLITYLKDQ